MHLDSVLGHHLSTEKLTKRSTSSPNMGLFGLGLGVAEAQARLLLYRHISGSFFSSGSINTRAGRLWGALPETMNLDARIRSVWRE
jgi:hypothetical protein